MFTRVRFNVLMGNGFTDSEWNIDEFFVEGDHDRSTIQGMIWKVLNQSNGKVLRICNLRVSTIENLPHKYSEVYDINGVDVSV